MSSRGNLMPRSIASLSRVFESFQVRDIIKLKTRVEELLQEVAHLLHQDDIKPFFQLYQQIAWNEAFLKEEIYDVLILREEPQNIDQDEFNRSVKVMSLLNLTRISMLNEISTHISWLYRQPNILKSKLEEQILHDRVNFLLYYFKRYLEPEDDPREIYKRQIYEETISAIRNSIEFSEASLRFYKMEM